MKTAISAIMLFLFISCDSKRTAPASLKINLIDSISIKLPNDVQPTTRALFFNESIDNQPVLSYLNQSKNEIILFNLEDKNIKKRIKFDIAGPNGVGEVRGFYIHNSDSIFITPKSGHLIFYVIKVVK